MHSAYASWRHICTQLKQGVVVSIRILLKVKQGKGPVHVEYKMNCFSNQELRFLAMNETVVD